MFGRIVLSLLKQGVARYTSAMMPIEGSLWSSQTTSNSCILLLYSKSFEMQKIWPIWEITLHIEIDMCFLDIKHINNW